MIPNSPPRADGKPAKQNKLAKAIGRLKPARLAGTSGDDNDKQEPKAGPPDLAWRPFPVDALPEPCKGFVTAAAKAIGCDESFVALPLLSGLAAAIGNARSIAVKKDWSEPAVIWTAIIGESGTMKTPAMRETLRPVKKRQSDAMKAHQEQLAGYESEKTRHDAAKDAWKRRKGSTEPPPVPPAEPVCERFWCDDATVESLVRLLQSSPRGLLLAADELDGWLSSFNQYKGGKGGDKQKYLSMHGAGELMVDRRTGDARTIFVKRAAVSITGGVQPEILRQSLGRENFHNGLTARFLLAMPPRKAKQWTEAEIATEIGDQLADVYGRLWELEPGIDPDGDQYPKKIRLTAEAKTAWVAWVNRHGKESAELTGDLAAAWSKLEGYCARLALVLHLVAAVGGDAQHDAVDELSMQHGIELVDWFKHETRRVYGVLAGAAAAEERRELVELIERKGGRITPSQLQAACRRYHDEPVELAEAALEKLVKAGVGTWETVKNSKGGRPSFVFCLHPATPCQ